MSDPQPPPPPHHPPEKPSPVSVEDAGSQALTEALRSSFAIVKIIMILLVIVFVGSGIFTVPSQEIAVILRFGKPIGEGAQRLLQPGLHWSFPYPIDEVVKIPIGQLQAVASTIGWYATTPELELSNSEPEPGPALNPGADGYTLTGDGNIIHVRSTLQYRISDPINYVFNFASGTNEYLFSGASNLVQNALNNALFYVSSRYTVDNALRNDIAGFREKVLNRVQTLVDSQNLGITIEQCLVQTLAPRQTKEAFQNVLAEQQNAVNARDTARADANEKLSKAEGEAKGLVNAGETARTRLVQSVEAEAKYFTDQLPFYQRNPALFKGRLQVDTLQRLMTNANVEKFFLPDRADGKPRELRIQLNREPRMKEKEQEMLEGAPITRDTKRR